MTHRQVDRYKCLDLQPDRIKRFTRSSLLQPSESDFNSLQKNLRLNLSVTEKSNNLPTTENNFKFKIKKNLGDPDRLTNSDFKNSKSKPPNFY